MNRELEEKLRQLKIEDFIWLIYIGIIFLSWYSNQLERKYFAFQDVKSKEEYRRIIIFIFSILNIVYFYFLIDAKEGIKSLKPWDSKKKKDLNTLSFVASLFICISGLILLYIAIEDEDINVELAFS